MKILGCELNDFMDQAWPGDDWYWQHDIFDEYAEPDVLYDTEDLGDLFWQGVGAKNSLSLETVIKQWQKAKVSSTFVVTIPNSSVQSFKQYIASIQGTIQ